MIVFSAGNESKTYENPLCGDQSFESTLPAYDAAMAAKGGFITVAATTNDGSA